MILCDPMDCNLPGSSVHGIFQARVLEWVTISFSRGSSQPRDWTWVSRIAGRFFTSWATREARLVPCSFFVHFLLYKAKNLISDLFFVVVYISYCNRVDLQYCVSFRCIAEWFKLYICIYSLLDFFFSYRLPQNFE